MSVLHRRMVKGPLLAFAALWLSFLVRGYTPIDRYLYPVIPLCVVWFLFATTGSVRVPVWQMLALPHQMKNLVFRARARFGHQEVVNA